MLLESIDVYYASTCLTAPDRLRIRAELSADISDVMPYLNRVVRDASYEPKQPYLTLHKEFRLITLYATDMTMIKAINNTDVWQVLAWLKDLINDTYARRNEIEPDWETRKRPHPLQVYRCLPQTNCRVCGEETCLAFANALFLGDQPLARCTPLLDPKYHEQRVLVSRYAQALGHDVDLPT